MPGFRPCPCFLHEGKAVPLTTFKRCRRREQAHEDQDELEAQPAEAVVEPVDERNREPLDAVDAREQAFFTSVAFAKELVEQVVRKRAKATGITDILQCFKRHYGEFMDLPEGVVLPASWHKVRKLATDGKMPLYTIRHLCHECDWMFPVRTFTQVCQRCRKDTRWLPKKKMRPARTALYFQMADMFRRMFNVPALADNLIALTNIQMSDVPLADRHIQEAWDGTILHGLMRENNMQLVNGDDGDGDDAEIHDGDDGDGDGEGDDEGEGDDDGDASGDGDNDDLGEQPQEVSYLNNSTSSTLIYYFINPN